MPGRPRRQLQRAQPTGRPRAQHTAPPLLRLKRPTCAQLQPLVAASSSCSKMSWKSRVSSEISKYLKCCWGQTQWLLFVASQPQSRGVTYSFLATKAKLPAFTATCPPSFVSRSKGLLCHLSRLPAPWSHFLLPSRGLCICDSPSQPEFCPHCPRSSSHRGCQRSCCKIQEDSEVLITFSLDPLQLLTSSSFQKHCLSSAPLCVSGLSFPLSGTARPRSFQASLHAIS